MKVRLVFVPPGGGEADYSLDFNLPSTPQPGDYISVRRPGQDGTADFIVRRTWWHLFYPSDELSEPTNSQTAGDAKGILVECEFALNDSSSESHKLSCESYRRTGKLQEFEATAY